MSENVNARDEAREGFLAYGPAVILRHWCDRCQAGFGHWCTNSDGTIRNHLHIGRVRDAIAKKEGK